MECISKERDLLSTKCDNILLLGDFNSKPTEEAMPTFYQTRNRKSLVTESTCYKNPNKSSCVDLIMRNRRKSFQNSWAFETGPSDFNKMTLTILKVSFKKKQQSFKLLQV